MGILSLIFAAAGAWAGQGEEIFKTQRCSSCHRPETGKVNPSLKEMAQAYQGKKDQLINYLNGGVKSVIRAEKAGIMKRYMEKTMALSVGTARPWQTSSCSMDVKKQSAL